MGERQAVAGDCLMHAACQAHNASPHASCAACSARLQVSHGRSKDDAARQRRPWPFRWLPPRRVHQRQAERRTERLVQRVNVGSQLALNALAFLASLADSRRNEYEADLLALCLMRAAGGPPLHWLLLARPSAAAWRRQLSTCMPVRAARTGL